MADKRQAVFDRDATFALPEFVTSVSSEIAQEWDKLLEEGDTYNDGWAYVWMHVPESGVELSSIRLR
eukprot:8970825-Pyramimonas_sp.AAC.1